MVVVARKPFICRASDREWQASARYFSTGLIQFALALILLGPLQAFAQADAPPHDYLDLGPHFVVAPGMGAVTEYRDTLLRKSASARLAGTATYRGWSLSGALDQSLASNRHRASELLASYSHKLPYADLHIGIVHAQIDGEDAARCTAASLGLSSNSLPSTKLDATFQHDLSHACWSAAIGASQVLWKRGIHQIDLRVSMSSWKTDVVKTEGSSLRLMGRSQLNGSRSLHYHAGYVDSAVKQGVLRRKSGGTTGGVNYVWEFR